MTREEIATQILVAGVREAGQDLTPKQLLQVAVALTDMLIDELRNPSPRNVLPALETLL